MINETWWYGQGAEEIEAILKEARQRKGKRRR